MAGGMVELFFFIVYSVCLGDIGAWAYILSWFGTVMEWIVILVVFEIYSTNLFCETRNMLSMGSSVDFDRSMFLILNSV